MSARGGFYLVQFIALLIGLFIYQKVHGGKPDNTKIYVPPTKSPFGIPSDKGYTETTVFLRSKLDTKNYLTQTVMSVIMTTVIHFYFQVNQVILLQLLMAPFTVYESSVVKKYIFGAERAFEEKYENELEGLKIETSEIEETEVEEKTETKVADKRRKIKKDKVDVSLEAVLLREWDNGTNADFSKVTELLNSNNINYQTSDNKWTCFMIACGLIGKCDDEQLNNMMILGADVTLQDSDGWTCAHWASFHNNLVALNKIIKSIPLKHALVLLEKKSKDGKTALQLAQEENNLEIIDILKKTIGLSSKSKNAKDTDVNQID